MFHPPDWLQLLSWMALLLGFACALLVALDELKNPQHMWIMNIVWPVNALYFGPVALWGYYRFGRLSTHHAMMQEKQPGEHGKPMPEKQKPFWAMAAVATSHCAAGCTLGDIIAESIIFAAALSFFGSVAHHALYAKFILDFALAYALGIIFQYFTIVPMRKLGPAAGLWAALKADTLSLTAFEIGLFGWMALTSLVLFPHGLPTDSAAFWFMMQIGMIVGFFTSYPVNWWLLKIGWKEKM